MVYSDHIYIILPKGICVTTKIFLKNTNKYLISNKKYIKYTQNTILRLFFSTKNTQNLYPFLPLQQGFDEYLGLPYSNDMWPVDYDGNRVTPASNLPNKLRHPTLPLIDGNEKIRELWTLDDQAELTTLYTERAIQFIKKNREQPFFLYFAHSMPHVPLAVSNKFRGKSKQGLYGDVMLEVDWSVQQVLETIEELNLDENTLIIFTSDNGPWFSFGNHAGSTGGLREAKATTFEGGQRVPCIMCWKGVIPRGTVYNQLASTII